MFVTVNHDNKNQTTFTQQFVENYVKPALAQRANDTAEKKAKRVLFAAFDLEIATGEVKDASVKLAAMVLSGELDAHEILPGLLEAHYRRKEIGNFWRRGLTGGGYRREDDLECLEAEERIMRASLYFAQKLKGRVQRQVLKSLNLVDKKVIAAERARQHHSLTVFNEELLLPRPFQSINFKGSTATNARRAHDIVRTCLALDLYTPAPLYSMFDATYVARNLDLGPAFTTHDHELRIVGNICNFEGEFDQSTKLYSSANAVLKALHPDKMLQQDQLASEVLEVFLHHASHKDRLPCITIAAIAKARIFAFPI